MLRLIVLLLLLANGGYFAWSHGYLLAWGLGPAQQSEPQRLDQQIRPDSVRVLKADEFKRVESAAAASPRPPECLQASPLDEARVASLRPLLEGWPVGSWFFDDTVEPARWIIYMGKYLTMENVNRKKAELRQIGVSFEPVTNPSMELGLSLGSFTSQQAAQAQLDKLADRGVRTARVTQERAEVRGQRLVLPAVDDSLRPRLDELRATLNANALRTCR